MQVTLLTSTLGLLFGHRYFKQLEKLPTSNTILYKTQMADPGREHHVYKKDKDGSTYVVGEIVFGNQIIQHDPCLSMVRRTLMELPQFRSRKDDIWIIGYAKSGTHWLTEIINLLTRKAATKPLADKHRKFLELKYQTEYFEIMTSPRMLNTHFPLKLMPKHILDNAKIVFPLRNPKSVAVSYFFHRSNVAAYDYDGTFNGFLPDFIEGMESLYGSWFEMITAYWEYLKDRSNVLFVVYEDLIKNPVEGIKDISDFLGLGHEIIFCQHVSEQSKFEAMKTREQQSNSESSFWKGQKGFIRKGSVTDWKTHFTVAQNEMFDAIYEEKMRDHPDLKEKIKFL